MPELILPIVGFGLALATVKDITWRWVLLPLAAGLVVGFFTPLAVPDGFALAAMFIAIGALVIAGLDKSIETMLVAASPQWLTDLTTRF